MDQLLSPGDSILPSPTANLFEKNIGALINNFKSNFSDELSMPALNYTCEKLPFVIKSSSQFNNQDPFQDMSLFDNLSSFQREQTLKDPQVEFIVNSFLHDSNALQSQHYSVNQFQHSFNDSIMETLNHKHQQNYLDDTTIQQPFMQNLGNPRVNAGHQRKQQSKTHTFHNDQYQHEYNTHSQPQNNNQKQSQLNKFLQANNQQKQTLQNQMQKHSIQKQLKSKNFQCPQCISMFGRMHDLKRHLYVHDNNKPFTCQYCKKGFSRRDALKRHEKNIEDGTKKNCAERTASDSEAVNGKQIGHATSFNDGNQIGHATSFSDGNQIGMKAIDPFPAMDELSEFGGFRYTNTDFITAQNINSKTFDYNQFSEKGSFDSFNQISGYEIYQL